MVKAQGALPWKMHIDTYPISELPKSFPGAQRGEEVLLKKRKVLTVDKVVSSAPRSVCQQKLGCLLAAGAE